MPIEQIDILAANVRDRSIVLEQLPLTFLLVDRGCQAIKCLRQEKILTLISRWDLVDMGDGELLRRVINAKPGMPTIAFIESGNREQEVAARALGVKLVLPEDIDDGQFHRVICELLGLKEIAAIKARCGTGQNEIINREENALLHLSGYHSFTPSWVCQSASDRPVARPGRRQARRIAAVMDIDRLHLREGNLSSRRDAIIESDFSYSTFYSTLTPSWVCQSASDHPSVRPSRQTRQRPIAAIDKDFEK
jgi:hypothetical protein